MAVLALLPKELSEGMQGLSTRDKNGNKRGVSKRMMTDGSVLRGNLTVKCPLLVGDHDRDNGN